MPKVEWTTGFERYGQGAPELEPAPGFREVVGAGFELESAVLNTIDLLNKPRFEPVPNFSVGTWLKNNPDKSLFDRYADQFVGVHSEDEALWLAQKIAEQERLREVVAAGGWWGLGAQIAAGVIDPTIFIPLVGTTARGVRAVRQAATSGLAAASIQEAPLAANQPTRTAEEIGLSIGASTILGGLLGAGVAYLRKGQFDELSRGMASSPGELAIRSPFEMGVGAQVAARPDPGGLARGARTAARALDTNVLTRSPVTDAINMQVVTPEMAPMADTFRRAMWSMTTGGLENENAVQGIAPFAEGTAQARIKTGYGQYAIAHDAWEEAYSKYVLGESTPSAFGTIRARLVGHFSGDKLNYSQFREEISRALANGERHQIPEIAQAAKVIREKIFNEYFDQGKKAKIFEGLEEGDEADLSYLTQMYDPDKVSNVRNAAGESFVQMLTRNNEKRLANDFMESVAKLNVRKAQVEEEIRLMELPPEEVKAVREATQATLDKLEADVPVELDALAELIAESRRVVNTVDKWTDEQLATFLEFEVRERPQPARPLPEAPMIARRRIKQQAKEELKKLVELGGEDLEKLEVQRRDLKRRLRILSRSKVALEEKQRKKLAKIEKNEESQLKSLNKVARKAVKVQAELSKLSDEKLDEKLADLRTSFARAAEQYDKGEERLAELAREGEPLFKLDEPVDLPNTKVVDNSGKPLTVYHGTTAEFQNFDETFITGERGDALGRGFYFTADEDFARETTKETFEEARAAGRRFPKEFKPNARVIKAKLNLQNPLIYKAGMPTGPELTALAKAEGHDGIIFSTGNDLKTKYREIVVFDSSNIHIERPGGVAATEEMLGQAVRQEARADRLTTIAARLERADIDRAEARQLIQEGLDDVILKVQQINAKRAVRADRLLKQAEELDPKIKGSLVEELRGKQQARLDDFLTYWHARGADNLDPNNLSANVVKFTEQARQDAEATKDKIMGSFLRLPGIDMIPGARGPELARSLNLPFKELEPWLELDIDKIVRSYLMTVVPDIELKRVLGDFTGDKVMEEAVERKNKAIDALQKRTKLAPDHKDYLSLEQASELESKIDKAFFRLKEDFLTVLTRLRHLRGLPKDHKSIDYRLANFVTDLNILRFMGTVTLSSLPDLGRPIMKYGLQKVFGQTFGALVGNLKQIKLAAREAKLSGSATDTIHNARATGVLDLMEHVGHRSRFERAVEYGSGKMGIVAGFSVWTDLMKKWTALIAINDINEALERVVKGTGTQKDITRLARVFIDGPTAEKIWKEMTMPGKGEFVDGRWYPNTEMWDRDVRIAYRAALAEEIDNTIITPGPEKPGWSDKDPLRRVLAQFKSFAFASTYKTALSGMQQRDMAIFNGVMASLAMGAVSYYLWAITIGGEAYDEMMNAGLDKWADEAIQRSGVLGILGEVQRIGERIPAVQPYASFSGTRSTRRAGDNLVEAVLGPSFDLGVNTADIITGIHEPTKGTIHDIRQLMPYQNLFYLRQMFDKIEAAVPVPEKRQ